MKTIIVVLVFFNAGFAHGEMIRSDLSRLEYDIIELKERQTEMERRIRQFGISLAAGGGSVGAILGAYERLGQLTIWKSRSFLAVAGASAALVFTGGVLYLLSGPSNPTDENLRETLKQARTHPNQFLKKLEQEALIVEEQ